MKKIPLVNLQIQHEKLKSEIDYAINDVIKNSQFIRGPYVDKFEKEFAGLTKMKYCLSCANGTDALYIAIKALGAKQDDEIIVPAHSWISTSEIVTQSAAKVIFCDTNKDDFTIDVSKIEKLITKKTVGIIPVHLFGQPADMDPILELAKKYNLWIVEDCAQAHLAKYKNKLVGSFGNFGSFSFYPGKNLGAMGDAGALVTNNLDLFEKSAKFARHGGLIKGKHEFEGINSRMDGIQAAILSVKAKFLIDWNLKRRQNASIYNKELSTLDEFIEIPFQRVDTEHVWHLYVIKTEFRDELASWLKEKGIQTAINYPVSLPFLEAYKRFKFTPNDFPNAFQNQNKILSLPMYPELTNSDIQFVIESIKSFPKFN
nr:DegT/DnrJ/EryC1/StrS family aminotransferase [Prochlorococcus marinus]